MDASMASRGRRRGRSVPPRKGRSSVPVDHVGRRPQLVAEEVDVELVRPADPAPRYNARPTMPGPRLDLVLEALRRLRDVGLHLGVDGHLDKTLGQPLRRRRGKPSKRDREAKLTTRARGKIQELRRFACCRGLFPRSEGCPAHGAGVACWLVSYMPLARFQVHTKLEATGNCLRLPAAQKS